MSELRGLPIFMLLARGRNFGSVISSVTLLEAHLDRHADVDLVVGAVDQLVCSRGPSSSSTMATLYGVSALKAGCCDWWTTIQLKTVPRPLSRTHSAFSDRQRAQSSAGGKRTCPQSAQRLHAQLALAVRARPRRTGAVSITI